MEVISVHVIYDKQVFIEEKKKGPDEIRMRR